jgi:hypothetical protein
MRMFLVAAALAATAATAMAAPISVAIDVDSTRSTTGGPITTQPGFTSWDLTNVAI